MRRLLILPCLLASAATLAASTQTLQVGQSASVAIVGNGFSNELVLQVPEGVRRLRLRATAADPTADIDLLARRESPFPDATFDGAAPTPEYLFEHATHRSASAGGDEFIVLADASGRPLTPGPLHLSLLNFSSQPQTVSFVSEVLPDDFFFPIQVVFDDPGFGCNLSGWNDTSPRSPVGGNNGTTLGQQRRNALLEAARLLSEALRPLAPLTVQACWDDLEYSNGSGVLAQAGANFLLVDDPGQGRSTGYLAERFVVYPGTVAAHQAGTSLCRFAGGSCSTAPADIHATFNLKVDQASNPASRFDYGFTPQSGTASFVSVAMHEITHGLGFFGLVDLDSASPGYGQQKAILGGQPYDDAYGRHVRTSLGGVPSPTPLLRQAGPDVLAAMTSNTGLRFAGPFTLASPDNPFRGYPSPGDQLALHAPGTIARGSTYSHLSTLNNSAGPQLMTAAINSAGPRDLGLARLVLEDVGWYREAHAARSTPQVLEGQYFDPRRNGHGFEIRRIAGIDAANGDPLYFVTFYSYDENGRPEYFTATGTVVDGVFAPAKDATTGDSLLRNLYLGRESTPQTQADPAPDYDGQVRIDFGPARDHPACFKDAEGRSLEGPLAVLSFQINAEQTTQWCVQALTDPETQAELDFSNQWYDPADGGWGLSVVSVPGEGGDALALEIYYPDAQGKGRWALVQTDRYVPGQTLPVWSVSGFCRDCPASELQFQQIGQMQLDLRAPGQGQSTVSFDITWPGVEGGRFVRNGAPIVPVGSPAF